MDTLGSIVYLICLVGSCHIVARRGVRTGLSYKPWFLVMVLSAAILMPFVAIYVFVFRRKMVDPQFAEMLKLRDELTRSTAEALKNAKNQDKQ
jgi:beta-lactamase regulating signal transducer with metallopeptidase domain